jgi:serine/threonine protein phosphatase PrpC
VPYRFSAETDTGRRRQANEDAVLAPLTVATADGGEWLLAAVADGVGGAVGGAAASATAIMRFRESFLASHDQDPRERLRQATLDANDAVIERAEIDASLRGMATTLVGAVVLDQRIWFVNVGDSRGYLLQDSRFYQATADHSLVAEAVRAGVLTPEEAAHRPERHVITRSLGQAPGVDVDLHGPLRFSPGDIALLCSDGLHDAVPEEMILATLEHSPVESAARELVVRANDAGGPDNISVVVVAHVAAV